MNLICEWCGQKFRRQGDRGPIPRYCSASHRQRAYEARRAVEKAYQVASQVDLSMFEAVNQFSAESLGLAKAMEKATAPVREALSSVAIKELEASRRAAQTMLNDIVPKIDLSMFEAVNQFSAEAVIGLVVEENLTTARNLVDRLASEAPLEFSLQDLTEAKGVWDDVEATVENLQYDIDAKDSEGLPVAAGLLVVLMSLMLVEASASSALIDVAIFSIEAFVGLAQMAWQLASVPAIVAPLSTIGGVAGLVYLIDRAKRNT